MSAHTEAARLLRNERNAGQLAQKARALIDRMPDTHANLGLVLDAIEAKAQSQTWGDFSDVIEHLNAAIEALEGVYAYEVAA